MFVDNFLEGAASEDAIPNEVVAEKTIASEQPILVCIVQDLSVIYLNMILE